MNKPNNKRGAVLLSVGGGGALALLLVAVLGGTSLTASATTAAPPAPPNGCTTTVHYDAYEAPSGSDQFGPNQESHDLAVNVARHASKDCTDPLYAAGDVLFVRDGINASATEIEALAQQYVADHAKWLADVQTMWSQVSSFTAEYVSAGYETMGMMPGASPDVMPSIMKFDHQHALGWARVAHLSNGETRFYRIACDEQFSAPSFPNVPTTVTPPPTTPPTTPTPTTPPSGKHVSERPVPDAPIVPAPPGGYVDRSGTTHTEPYTPPASTVPPAEVGKGDSGPGAVNTVPSPTTSSPAAQVPVTAAPTVAPVAP